MGNKRKWTPEPGARQPRGDRTGAESREQPRRTPRTRRTPPPPPPPPPSPPPSSPTADEAPTGRVATPPPPPPSPPRGHRPYPSASRGGPGENDDYERYDTGGWARGQPRPEDHEPPPWRSERPWRRTTTEHGFDSGPGGPAGTGGRGGAGPGSEAGPEEGAGPRIPRKITVTRVAALRSRQLSGQAVDAFKRATKADGADKSGLTSLTYAVMLNYASDAAMAIALANTLFFAASSGESRGRVALYLLITIAPFALVAPVIGPALDRVQRGRRLAMCVASGGQALMLLIMALNFTPWVIYPAALGKMVLSKSFMVLKAAVTPRVVPPDITLSKTNARLAVFGLASAGAFGAIASGFNWAFGETGALWFAVAICVVGAVQAMRIPAWVEVTEGEVPAALTTERPIAARKHRTPMTRHVAVGLWGNGSIRLLTGFLMMFAAFAVKAQAEANEQSPFVQLLLLGIIGAAAGMGGFLGNALGSRMHFGKPDQVVLGCLGATLGSTVIAALLSGLTTAAIVGLVGATSSALAKNSLDAVIQHDLPEESRASAFGRSETVLQLSWVFGGAVGLLLPPTYWVGFLVVSLLLAVGLAQTWIVRGGGSLIPPLRGRMSRAGAGGASQKP